MNFGPGTPVPSRPFNSAQPRRQQERDLNNQHSLFPYTTITAIEIPQADRQTDSNSLPSCLSHIWKPATFLCYHDFLPRIIGFLLNISLISCFGRDVDEIYARMRHYAAWSGNDVPTLRDNLLGPIGCPETSVRIATLRCVIAPKNAGIIN